MQIKRQKIEQILAQIFDELQEIEDPVKHTQAKENFVFHMVDWIHNLEELFQLYTTPEKYDTATSEKIIIGFLYHVIPHLNMAGSLLLGSIPNSFEDKEE